MVNLPQAIMEFLIKRYIAHEYSYSQYRRNKDSEIFDNERLIIAFMLNLEKNNEIIVVKI